MMRIFAIILVALFLGIMGGYLLGGERAAQAAGVSAPVDAGAVSIIEDEALKAFRFVIDGREVARIDASGLKVVEDVAYGGTMTDAGRAWVEQTMNAGAAQEGEGDAD